ncbi:hypothetical protein ACRZ5S_18330 [Vibrio scophthalmi]|uniref:hypothetical protein n=1 Tax=Vibrio scophthalmi TaxID=45658 RepID=UPI003EBDBE18
MEMLIVSSEQQMRLVMLFSQTSARMSDKAIIQDLASYPINSTVYPAFRAASDLRIERIRLPLGDDKSAALNGGDFLYRYLAKGYICLGDYAGKPKPDLSPWGVRSVRKQPRIGFGL